MEQFFDEKSNPRAAEIFQKIHVSSSPLADKFSAFGPNNVTEFSNAEVFSYILNIKKLPFVIFEFAFDDEFSLEDKIQSTEYSFGTAFDKKPLNIFYYTVAGEARPKVGGYFKTIGPLTTV